MRQQPERSSGASGVLRSGLLKRTAVVALAVAVALLVYGVAIEPRLILDVEEEQAVVPGLPLSWEGREVALLADLQVGMWPDDVGMARRAVDEAIERDPAFALVAGDFVYGDGGLEEKVSTAVAVVRPLVAAGIPTFAVLGNHDHASGAAPSLRDALRDAGVEVLHNEAVAVPPAPRDGSAPLYVVGIGAERPGEARPQEALAEVPDGAPRLVMMHNPASFARLPAGSAPLAVAGHTHGGQLRVPFMPRWSFLSLIEDGPVHADGWIDGFGAPGNQLYVNRGIGMSLIPVRLNCPPELTIFELTDGRP